MSATPRRLVTALTIAALLAGCVTTQEGRIGRDDGADSCRPLVVALDSTGDFFGEDILQGAAIGAGAGALLGGLIAASSGRGQGRDVLAGVAIGAAAGAALGGAGGYLAARQRQSADQAVLAASVGDDLTRENAEIDKTQRALDRLIDCRVANAGRIRNDVAARRITREQGSAAMARERDLMGRDVQLARSINARIATRGAEFDTAIAAVAPAAAPDAAVRQAEPIAIQARSEVVLRARPDGMAPEIARVKPRETVRVRPMANGYAMVETGTGLRGYAPSAGLGTTRPAPAAQPVTGAAADGGLRRLAGTNVARRDQFEETVENADRLARGGFELAG
jgi:hypothetical protein